MEDDLLIDELDIHDECKSRCRSSIIAKYIERYPESLAKVDDVEGSLPLHLLLENPSSSIDDALMMIEKYPAAVKHRDYYGLLPLQLECLKRTSSSIILKCIEIYPEALAIVDRYEFLPLHSLIKKGPLATDAVLVMMEKYPAALEHQTIFEDLPIHLECKNACRSSIISKCIELYPEALAKAYNVGNLPLHRLLENQYSSVEDALMMIEKYPAALTCRNSNGNTPINIECKNACRAPIISKCIELCPQLLDNQVITIILGQVNQSNFHDFASVLSIVFAASPLSLYDRNIYIRNDIRHHPYYRRKLLNLLPRHVFTPTHDEDYRDLNWQPRAAMILLFSQIQ
jgi:ankyrin repeat protein